MTENFLPAVATLPNNAVRHAFVIEYDGRQFCGWQNQHNGIAVQQVLQNACTHFIRHPVEFWVSGRTDSGVHARGQVAHADISSTYTPDKIIQAINYHVRPHAVAILQCKIVNNDFHARFSCVQRRYCYRILCRYAPAVLDAGRVWHIKTPLCLDSMRAAANDFLGKHDFSTFRAVGCGAASPIRTLDECYIQTQGQEIHIHVAARGFLYRQVRSMVGTLVAIGQKKLPITYVAEALLAKNRAACGPVAPPDGLYFMAARYDSVQF